MILDNAELCSYCLSVVHTDCTKLVQQKRRLCKKCVEGKVKNVKLHETRFTKKTSKGYCSNHSHNHSRQLDISDLLSKLTLDENSHSTSVVMVKDISEVHYSADISDCSTEQVDADTLSEISMNQDSHLNEDVIDYSGAIKEVSKVCCSAEKTDSSKESDNSHTISESSLNQDSHLKDDVTDDNGAIKEVSKVCCSAEKTDSSIESNNSHTISESSLNQGSYSKGVMMGKKSSNVPCSPEKLLYSTGTDKFHSEVPTNHFGPIPNIEVGTIWKNRKQVFDSRVHCQHFKGIHGRQQEGAYSIILSGKYEDDEDYGETIVYTGCGGRYLSNKQSWTQTLSGANKALSLNFNSKSWKKGKPIRVIRTSTAKTLYSPKHGHRYDGIYKIKEMWKENGVSGHGILRFLLVRVDHHPAPWLRALKHISAKKQITPCIICKTNPAENVSTFRITNVCVCCYLKSLSTKVVVQMLGPKTANI